MKIDHLVLGQRLEILTRRSLGKTRIEEALAVLGPGEAREFDPLDLVSDRLPGGDVKHAHGPPVGAPVLNRVEDMAPVLAGHPFGERGRSVLGPGIGIDQQPLRSLEAFTNIERGLILEAAVALVEISPALFHRGAHTLVIIKLGHARLEGGAARQRGEETVGDAVLRIDPGLDLGVFANVVLKPAIRIGDGASELGFHEIGAAIVGVGDRWR